ncbi:hypothetical protein EDB85DRAFT_2159902 [Lactarius pseudohatsudake]|nr:hypothetical protein EDB85DRAFT_2159902 [Lactarius pseudohatsudake]
MTGIKDTLESAIDEVVGSVSSVEGKVENSGSSLLNWLGDKVLGQTAEEKTKNAPAIAPDATTTIPVTHGRRSRHPDGQDPFHGDAPAPANKS